MCNFCIIYVIQKLPLTDNVSLLVKNSLPCSDSIPQPSVYEVAVYIVIVSGEVCCLYHTACMGRKAHHSPTGTLTNFLPAYICKTF